MPLFSFDFIHCLTFPLKSYALFWSFFSNFLLFFEEFFTIFIKPID